jgi:hypothetical protein
MPFWKAVVEKDVGVTGRDDAAKAVIVQRPRRVLATGTEPKLRAVTRIVAPDSAGWFSSNSGFGVMPSASKAPVVKEELAETGALDALQKLLGMIWSVSTFARSSGAAMPVSVVNGCMILFESFEPQRHGGHRSIRRAIEYSTLFFLRPPCPLWLICDLLASVLFIPLADVDQLAFNRGGDGHRHADEMGAPAFALATFKVAVTG